MWGLGLLLQSALHSDGVHRCCLSLSTLLLLVSQHQWKFGPITEQSSYCPKQQSPPRSIHTDGAYELFRCSHHLLKKLGLQGLLQSSIGCERWRCIASSPQINLPPVLDTSLEGKTLKQLSFLYGYGVTFAPHACPKKTHGMHHSLQIYERTL